MAIWRGILERGLEGLEGPPSSVSACLLRQTGAAAPLRDDFYHKVYSKGKVNTVAYYVLGAASHNSREHQSICGIGKGSMSACVTLYSEMK